MPTAAPTLDQLILLFTGDWIHDDNCWDTTPCYSITLACEIAKRCDTTQDFQLRKVLYGNQAVDNIDPAAITAIGLAVQRYRSYRLLQNTGRGL